MLIALQHMIVNILLWGIRALNYLPTKFTWIYFLSTYLHFYSGIIPPKPLSNTPNEIFRHYFPRFSQSIRNGIPGDSVKREVQISRHR